MSEWEDISEWVSISRLSEGGVNREVHKNQCRAALIPVHSRLGRENQEIDAAKKETRLECLVALSTLTAGTGSGREVGT